MPAAFLASRHTAAALVWAAALLCTVPDPAAGAQPDQTRLYELTTETLMPHLEVNLRYATTRKRRCLTPEALFTAFPVLDHPALAGCRLVPAPDPDGALSAAELACEGGRGTTGSALWRPGPGDRLSGRLEVRLGGKNMTFSQQVSARPVGACAAAGP